MYATLQKPGVIKSFCLRNNYLIDKDALNWSKLISDSEDTKDLYSK